MEKIVLEKTPVERLDDVSLLSTVIGAPDDTRVQRISAIVLQEIGGIESLSETNLLELMRVPGIGMGRARRILGAMELGRRALSGRKSGDKLCSSADVFEALCPLMAHEKVEVFRCLLLDSKLHAIGTELMSRGTLNASIIHPGDAFRPAVRSACPAVIFAHNHPSGDPSPSDDDRRITARLSECGKILGISVLDHLIIGARGSYFSFADEGLLEQNGSEVRGFILRS
ncbi:MAG: DNA repair protein RadC [Actinomycetota bacterium]|nr:DNA repair protein RadC [Actinomycetota bacterium]